MNFSLLATVATATLFMACTQAKAEDGALGSGMYVSVFGGASSPDSVQADISLPPKNWSYDLDLKSGYLLGAVIGIDVTDMIRGEVELSHSSWKSDGESHLSDSGSFGTGATRGAISATYLLTNVWLDLNNDTPFTPYVGGGAGVGWTDGDTAFRTGIQGFGDSELGFAFQLGGGLKFDLTDNVALDVGYRYKSILNVDLENSDPTQNGYTGADFSSHNAQLGLTYSF